MVYKFTKSGEKVLAIANELATDLGHSYIGTEHILYGLACEENGVASKVLKKQDNWKSNKRKFCNIRLYSKNKKNLRKCLY